MQVWSSARTPFTDSTIPDGCRCAGSCRTEWEAWKRLGVLASEMESAALCGGGCAGVRCGSVFHVIWNQEREAAGLDQTEDHDTDAAVRAAVEAIKRLIQKDRRAAERNKKAPAGAVNGRSFLWKTLFREPDGLVVLGLVLGIPGVVIVVAAGVHLLEILMGTRERCSPDRIGFPQDVIAYVGAVVGNALQIDEQLQELGAQLDGALAGLEAFDVAALGLVLHQIDDLFQRLHLEGQRTAPGGVAGQGGVQNILQAAVMAPSSSLCVIGEGEAAVVEDGGALRRY